jgi:hypothetical protein
MRIKDWHKFQHFRDRKPPWVKLYRGLLDDLEWHELDDKSARVLVMLWLIAAEYEGWLPDNKKLAFRLRMKESEVINCCSKLSHWLEQDDTNTISGRYQDDALERETEREGETEKETPRKRSAPPEPFELPDWVNRTHWDTWHSSPKRRKATDEQKRLSLAKLARWRDEGLDHAGALENAAVGGWQGLFLPEVKQTFAQQAADITRTTVPPKQEIDPVLAELTAHKGSAPPPEVRAQMQRLLRGAT